jgi:hypothetical protein
MKKNLFIGIDFSKSKFDVTVLENLADGTKAKEVFENSAKGYKSFLRWVKKQSKIKIPYQENYLNPLANRARNSAPIEIGASWGLSLVFHKIYLIIRIKQ